jgi:hypothetical protein
MAGAMGQLENVAIGVLQDMQLLAARPLKGEK